MSAYWAILAVGVLLIVAGAFVPSPTGSSICGVGGFVIGAAGFRLMEERDR